MLTEETLIQHVLTHNHSIQAGKSVIEVAVGQKNQAVQWDNPNLTLEASGLGGVSGYSGGYWHQPYDNLFRVEQLIETAGKRQLRIDAAQWQVVKQQWSYKHRLNQLIRDAKKAFYRVVHAQSNILIYDQIWLQPADVQQANAKRRRNGEISLSEFRRIELEALKTKHELESASLHFDTMRVQLAAFFSHQLSWDEVSVVTDFPKREVDVADLSAFLKKALEQRADVQVLQAENFRREIYVQLAEKQKIPDIVLAAQYQHNVSNPVVDSFGLGVSVKVPLWHSFEGQVAEQKAENRLLRSLSLQQQIDIQTELETSVAVFRQRSQSLERYEKITLNYAIQVHNNALVNYRNGALGLLELIDAERSFRDALLTYNRLMLERELAWLDLAYAMGE